MAKVELVIACRDSGGPLHCRECGRDVDRATEKLHFVESPECDCDDCHQKVMDELSFLDEED